MEYLFDKSRLLENDNSQEVAKSADSEQVIFELNKRVDFLLNRVAGAMLSELPDKNDFEYRKIQIWKAASAIGEVRAIINSENGKKIFENNRQILDSYNRMHEVVASMAQVIPDGDPACVISRWRLEKPLTPVAGDWLDSERRERDESSGKFIPKPNEFILIIE